MGVNQPGQHRGTTRIDDDCAGTGNRVHIGDGAHLQKRAVLNRERLHPTAGGTIGVDTAIDQHRIGDRLIGCWLLGGGLPFTAARQKEKPDQAAEPFIC